MSTDFNALVEAELGRHARQWEKTEERLCKQIDDLRTRIRELEAKAATSIDELPWLTKDFNVLYRYARAVVEAAQLLGEHRPELAALSLQVDRLGPAYDATEAARRMAR